MSIMLADGNLLPYSKIIFDALLDVFNDNDRGVIFSGNYMFRFWQQNSKIHEFEIVQRAGNSLDFETQRVIPFVELPGVEIPYVEDNDRSDYEKEFYVAFKIKDELNEYNQRVIEWDYKDESYQALLHGLEKLKQNPIDTIEGQKIAFKVKEPQRVDVFEYDGSYYQLLSLSMTLTRIGVGDFNNDIEVYGRFPGEQTDHLLHVFDGNIITARGLVPFKEVAKNIEQKNRFNTRTFTANFVLNYHGTDFDKFLLDEIDAVSGARSEFMLRIKRYDGTFLEHNVTVSSGSYNLRRNTVRRMNVEVERV